MQSRYASGVESSAHTLRSLHRAAVLVLRLLTGSLAILVGAACAAATYLRFGERDLLIADALQLAGCVLMVSVGITLAASCRTR